MGNIICNAYLFFKDECREAMNFYQDVFGGELIMQTYGDVDKSCPDATKDSIMHARLSGGDILLMASDDPGSGRTLGAGKIHLALGGNDEPKLRGLFDALSKGGKIGVPLEKQMWGDIYGDLCDQYGIHWMVNISAG
ncbi:MAG TPA: VOC family protein [Edaphocola sp.]|nr:VOC family protein [Edaphocola sp.]